MVMVTAMVRSHKELLLILLLCFVVAVCASCYLSVHIFIFLFLMCSGLLFVLVKMFFGLAIVREIFSFNLI